MRNGFEWVYCYKFEYWFIVINLSVGLLLLENIYFLFVFLFTLFFLNTLCIIPNIVLVRLFGPIGSGF